jgi:hypothetical protein
MIKLVPDRDAFALLMLRFDVTCPFYHPTLFTKVHHTFDFINLVIP